MGATTQETHNDAQDTPNSHKRKTDDSPSKESVKSAKLDNTDKADVQEDPNIILPPTNWRLDEIKEHYIRLDARWGRMFDVLPCKPFEQDLEKPINPFRVICDSILAQQISYKAAKAYVDSS